jgi:hypothetical protein
VDLNDKSSSSGQKLTPASCLGERALFLNKNGCIYVSARDLPSLSSNSIYFSVDLHPVLMHSLTTCRTEELSRECQVHNGLKRIRPSVRPFTIADHLLTFCHPHEWTKGLMFHEYHFIPESFKELWNKIRAKRWQPRTPAAPTKDAMSEESNRIKLMAQRCNTNKYLTDATHPHGVPNS